MPVYERGYTHWEPSAGRAWPAWWVIARRGIAEPLKKRWLLLLVLMSWVPAIVKGGIIYFKLKAGDLADLLSGGWSSVDPEGFLRAFYVALRSRLEKKILFGRRVTDKFSAQRKPD